MKTARPATHAFAAKGISLAIGLAVVVLADPVFAATCADLRSQISNIASGSAQSPAAAKWQASARQQQKAISAAERDARYFRCSEQGSNPRCQALGTKIGKMQANLRAIEKQLRRAGGTKSGNAGQKRKLQAKYKKQKCDAPARTTTARVRENVRSSAKTSKPGQKGFLKQLFGNKTSPTAQVGNYTTLPSGLVVRRSDNSMKLARSTEGDMKALDSRRSLARSRKSLSVPVGGTYRTLCVRTCDGYFFPVSFSTGSDQFVNDAARCSEMCPAGETELYVHRNPGGLQEDMTSLSGVAYTSLDNAYRFKTEYVSGCACRSTAPRSASLMTPLSGSSDDQIETESFRLAALEPNMSGTGANYEANTGQISAGGLRLSIEPLTPDQVPPYADPDTRLNLEEGFDPTAVTGALNSASRSVANAPAETNQDKAMSLPVLPSLPSIKDADSAPDEPVFSGSMDDTEATASAKGPIRVVGPEYYVSQ